MIDNQDYFRNSVEIYTSKWKLIVLSVFACVALAFTYLRYATYQYETKASIKIRDEKQSNKLPEITALQTYGLFSNGLNKVEDEIQILKSRSITEQVVRDLHLNIKFYVQGRIKEQETYLNPPLNVNFFENDSLISKVDTTLYVKITSPTHFELSNSNSLFSNGEVTEYDFGDKITTGFGDIIITPNIGNYGASLGSTVKIKLEPVNLTIEKYLEKIRVQSEMNSNIIKLAVNEANRDKGKLILDKLIEKYNNDAVSDKEAVVKVTSDFINNRLDIVSNELEQVDLTAENIKKNNRLSDLASQSSIFLQSEKENEVRLVETTNQIQLIDYMSNYMEDEGRDSDLLPANVGINDPNVAQTTKSYNDLVLQRDRILRNSSEKNPTVINLNNQIQALKSNLKQSLNNLRSSSQITLNSLNTESARINSQIYSAPKKERQFRDITRQQSIKESLYLYLLQKREETAITLGMSTPNAKIIDAAYSSTDPISPRRIYVLIAGLVLGFLLPIAYIFVSDLLDTKIHNKLDLKLINEIPFIGDIPKSSNKKSKRLVSKIDYSPKAEAFRLVRTNIEFLLKGKKEKSAKTVFVTSTKAQEGKSHTSINLASSVSFSNKKVLLIETDIRVPKVNEYLNLKSKVGLTDYISDTDLSIQDVTTLVEGNPNLNVIPSGTIPPNPSELLMSERVSHLFDEVKKKYDYIIVDTAAVGLVTDTLLLSDQADLFIYVVSAYNLDKRELHVAKTMFEEQRLPNMSILLNGTKKRSGYGYGYGYGSEKKSKKWFKKKA